MTNISPAYSADFYKIFHHSQIDEKMTFCFSNWTPRGSRRGANGQGGIVFFGLQYFVKKYLLKHWKEDFFDLREDVAVRRYERRVNPNGPVNSEHIKALHRLGYLPIEIRALKEGTFVPLRISPLVIFSTHDDFAWLPNFLETIMSTTVWYPCTSATTARVFRTKLESWAKKTGGSMEFVDWQAHDFSMRGMAGLEAAEMSGAAHLLFFRGTDTIPAIDFLENYYNADCEKELIGASVPASEHFVACSHIVESIANLKAEHPDKDEDEINLLADMAYFERMMTLYPEGIVSVVSDSFDYWSTITKTLPALKEKIMARKGKLVCRPDSGDPVRIVCGYKGVIGTLGQEQQLFDLGYEVVKIENIWYAIAPPDSLDGKVSLKPTNLTDWEVKGTIQCLYETFGGTKNEKGFIDLHPSISIIYGDGITLERAESIFQGLADKGFSSTNICLGVGSWNYVGNNTTRDTDGWAMKATACVVNGELREIFKDPKTDDGLKKSARGLLQVKRNADGLLVQRDQVTWDEFEQSDYEVVFKNGELVRDMTLQEIRDLAMSGIRD